MVDLAETPEFLERLRRREPEACRRMIVALGPDLEGYARHLLGDAQQVDDVVQEALLAVLQSVARFDGRSRLRTWVFSILHHKVADRIRKNQRERAREVPLEAEDPFRDSFDASGHWKEHLRDQGPGPEQNLEAGELRKRLTAAVQELPPRNREAFLLRDVHGLGADEAAAILEVTPGHFRVLLHRARVALRAALRKENG